MWGMGDWEGGGGGGGGGDRDRETHTQTERQRQKDRETESFVSCGTSTFRADTFIYNQFIKISHNVSMRIVS